MDNLEEIYFSDGRRKIDFLIVYNRNRDKDLAIARKRRNFLHSLIHDGLKIEIQDHLGRFWSLDENLKASKMISNRCSTKKKRFSAHNILQHSLQRRANHGKTQRVVIQQSNDNRQYDEAGSHGRNSAHKLFRTESESMERISMPPRHGQPECGEERPQCTAQTMSKFASQSSFDLNAQQQKHHRKHQQQSQEHSSRFRDDETRSPKQQTSVDSADSDAESGKNDIVYVKIHAPWTVLCTYAEHLKLRKPIKESQKPEMNLEKKKKACDCLNMTQFQRIFYYDHHIFPKQSRQFTYPFIIDKIYLFDIEDQETFFTSEERILIIDYILRRANYSADPFTQPIATITADPSDDAQKYNSANDETINIHAENDERTHHLAISSPTASNEKRKSVHLEAGAASATASASGHADTRSGRRQSDRTDQTKRSSEFGIQKLLSDRIIDDAFPLHEGDYNARAKRNRRQDLFLHWAYFSNVFKYQPLDYICSYFGETMAFYFAWLGFYTFWLLPAAIVGIFVFIYGLVSAYSSSFVNQTCFSNVTMCPLACRIKATGLIHCIFWSPSDYCLEYRLNTIVDNVATVFYSIFMSMWAALFLATWRRKQFYLAYRWNVHDMLKEDEPPRPEYIALLEVNKYEKSQHILTGKNEPIIDFWRNKVPTFIFSYSTVILSIILAFGFLFGVVLYKLVIESLLERNEQEFLADYSNIVAIVTGSCLSLGIILILAKVYEKVAVWLTDLENHRTQSTYDDNVTLKMYLLEFTNYYCSIFYIAFIEPYTRLKPVVNTNLLRFKGCPPGGCLIALLIQLAIIMVGKQIFSFIQEYTFPKFIELFKRWKYLRKKQSPNMQSTAQERADQFSNLTSHDDLRMNRLNSPSASSDVMIIRDANNNNNKRSNPKQQACGSSSSSVRYKNSPLPSLARIETDFLLADGGQRPLFPEYLEMMIQFGFMTLFIPAFPLAPFFAVINNIFEIRGDAVKFTSALRRPVPNRSKNIGVWGSILQGIFQLSIKTNAIIIAFSTTIIDRMVYQFSYSAENSVDGYFNWSLSTLNATYFPSNQRKYQNITVCHYISYREHFNLGSTEFSRKFWHVMAIKLVFILLFDTVLFVLIKIIQQILPALPKCLRTLMKIESVICQKSILNTEQHRAKQENPIVKSFINAGVSRIKNETKQTSSASPTRKLKDANRRREPRSKVYTEI